MLWTIILVASAFVVLPALYLTLCDHMRDSGVSHPPYISFFFLFATVIAWMLAPLVLSTVKEGTVWLVLLLPATYVALLLCSVVLLFSRQKSVYHRVAFWAGIAYCVLVHIVFWYASGARLPFPLRF